MSGKTDGHWKKTTAERWYFPVGKITHLRYDKSDTFCRRVYEGRSAKCVWTDK